MENIDINEQKNFNYPVKLMKDIKKELIDEVSNSTSNYVNNKEQFGHYQQINKIDYCDKEVIKLIAGIDNTRCKHKRNNFVDITPEINIQLKELIHIETDIENYLSADFKKIIWKYFGPENKNRQFADMLMKYARKVNQAGRVLVKDKKKNIKAQLKIMKSKCMINKT